MEMVVVITVTFVVGALVYSKPGPKTLNADLFPAGLV